MVIVDKIGNMSCVTLSKPHNLAGLLPHLENLFHAPHRLVGRVSKIFDVKALCKLHTMHKCSRRYDYTVGNHQPGDIRSVGSLPG